MDSSTLLLRFKAPLVSWGDSSHFNRRETRMEPTKSAVVGLLCAALGRHRSAPIADLNALRLGVAVLKEGMVIEDYHTIKGAAISGGDHKPEGKDTCLSWRFYLADADYLVGLEGDLDFLAELANAVVFPHWQLYFGRKSCVPSLPILHGLQEGDLKSTLAHTALALAHQAGVAIPVRCVLDRAPNESTLGWEVRRDIAINWNSRSFGSRPVVTTYFV